MKNWFETLDSRERIFVIGGAAIVLMASLFAFVWTPLDKGQAALESSVTTWERALAELRPLKGMQQTTSDSGQSGRAGSLQTPVLIVDQTLRARGLDRSLKRSQPTTSNGIRVEFENVVFDDLVLWLGDVSAKHAMQVSSGSLSAASRAGPGRINATLTLERSL
jgi:type II secretory pathway component PulM